MELENNLNKKQNISVCMATFNGEPYILQQLISILSQLGEEDELIISDNGSSDKTLSIIESLNDPRIKIFNYKYLSISGNFENAIKNANGDLIFLSDQDDIWMDGKVESFRNALKCASVVLSDCVIVD